MTPRSLHLFTDSKALFDVISKGSRLSEKRLMIDAYVARQGYLSEQIVNISFFMSDNNPADDLTKQMKQTAIRNILRTNTLQIVIEQWTQR